MILGGGPAALACALWRSRIGSVTVLYSLERVSETSLPRIEVVPVSAVAGLVELGVHPHSIGVFGFEERRMLAWESAAPVAVMTAAAAYVERPALDGVLMALARRAPSIELRCVDPASAYAEAAAMALQGACVVDATGRRAAMAARTMRPRRPWVARMFHVACTAGKSSLTRRTPFMVAALPQGYVYRASGHRCSTVGIVGRGQMLAGRAEDAKERIRASGAGWLIDDVADTCWTSIGARPASMQWAEGSSASFIGDAALSRDTLSSQGLASGLADARYAALISSGDDRENLATRRRLARESHASELVDLIKSCQWRGSEVWREYTQFLAGPARSC